MDDEQPTGLVDSALGEAIFSAMSVSSLWMLLLQKGLITKEETIATLDAVLFSLEDAQQDSAAGPEAIRHARTRVQDLLDTYVMTPPVGPWGPTKPE